MGSLLIRLFGEANATTQNNIDKLTGRFNMTLLRSKLVVCEEVNLRPGSGDANTLKTYITEKFTAGAPDDDFPIPRNSFPERAQKPARKKKEEDEPEWVVATESIYVNSPNWNENKQKTRMWQGVDSVRHECLFVIEDAEFWGRIRRKELLFEGLDSLKVQWAFQVVDRKIKNRRVLRVLEFNEKKLAEPLTPDAKSAILGSYTSIEAARGEPSLFDYGSKKPDP